MSNPTMAQSEPVEQQHWRARPEAPNAEVPTRQIDGTGDRRRRNSPQKTCLGSQGRY